MTTVIPLEFCSYRPAAWLRVTGEDSATFLQGQFTNDVRLAGPDRAAYGLWLNQKGKVLADSFIIRGAAAGEFWIGSYFSPGDVIRRRLEDYIVADDVTLEDATQEWAGVALVGEGSGAWLSGESSREGFRFPGRRAAGENWEWIFPFSSLDAVRTKLAGWRELGAAGLERSRMAAGIPAVPADIGPGDLPNEGGLDDEAISQTKGCYLGQEIMARLKSKGKIRRRLFRVAGRGPIPPLPAALVRGGNAAGELRSAVADQAGGGFTGLAMMILRGLVETEELNLTPPAAPLSLVAPNR